MEKTVEEREGLMSANLHLALLSNNYKKEKEKWFYIFVYASELNKSIITRWNQI